MSKSGTYENTENTIYKKFLHCIRRINVFLFAYMTNYIGT